MNRIALGTAQFGLSYGIANQAGQVSQLDAATMLKYAYSCGISTVDTAMVYGDSEICLGEIGVGNFNVITKLPAIPDVTPAENVEDWVKVKVYESLDKLKTKKLYGLLLHEPSQLLKQFQVPILTALSDLKSSGLIHKIGVSIYDAKELDAIFKIYQMDLVQVPFNPFDRRILDSGWLSRLKHLGVEVHVRSVFLQGLLLMPAPKIPPQFSQWNGLMTKWHTWLSSCNISALEACLAFILSHREIEKVVVGANSLNHLREIFAATSKNPIPLCPDFNCKDLFLIDPRLWKK